jgi:hypothetical protein
MNFIEVEFTVIFPTQKSAAAVRRPLNHLVGQRVTLFLLAIVKG